MVHSAALISPISDPSIQFLGNKHRHRAQHKWHFVFHIHQKKKTFFYIILFLDLSNLKKKNYFVCHNYYILYLGYMLRPLTDYFFIFLFTILQRFEFLLNITEKLMYIFLLEISVCLIFVLYIHSALNVSKHCK